MRIKHRKELVKKGSMSIRHLRKCPDPTEKDQTYKFEDFMQKIGLDKQKYKKILQCIVKKDKNESLYKTLGEDQYNYLKKIAYTLALYGFQFKQIQYLLLYQVSNSRIGKLAKKFIGEKTTTFPIKPIQICTNTSDILEEQVNDLILKGNNSSVTQLIQKIYEQEIIMYHIKSRHSLNIEQAKVLTPENRKK